jgi:hypothetical protein
MVENRDFVLALMPNAAQSLLICAFRCFPLASPIPGAEREAKRGPEGPLLPMISLRKSGAGEGIRTPDPNLGKVVLYP